MVACLLACLTAGKLYYSIQSVGLVGNDVTNIVKENEQNQNNKQVKLRGLCREKVLPKQNSIIWWQVGRGGRDGKRGKGEERRMDDKKTPQEEEVGRQAGRQARNKAERRKNGRDHETPPVANQTYGSTNRLARFETYLCYARRVARRLVPRNGHVAPSPFRLPSGNQYEYRIVSLNT